MCVYHYDVFVADFDVLYTWACFKINVVLKLVQGQRLSNKSVDLNFFKSLSDTYLS